MMVMSDKTSASGVSVRVAVTTTGIKTVLCCAWVAQSKQRMKTQKTMARACKAERKQVWDNMVPTFNSKVHPPTLPVGGYDQSP